jgi:hypothetical protein
MITLMNGVIHVTSQFPLDAAPLRHAVIFVGRGFTQHYPVVHGATEYYTEVHLHCFLRKLYSSWFVTQQVP